jgi:hypothetical protein
VLVGSSRPSRKLSRVRRLCLCCCASAVAARAAGQQAGLRRVVLARSRLGAQQPELTELWNLAAEKPPVEESTMAQRTRKWSAEVTAARRGAIGEKMVLPCCCRGAAGVPPAAGRCSWS